MIRRVIFIEEKALTFRGLHSGPRPSLLSRATSAWRACCATRAGDARTTHRRQSPSRELLDRPRHEYISRLARGDPGLPASKDFPTSAKSSTDAGGTIGSESKPTSLGRRVLRSGSPRDCRLRSRWSRRPQIVSGAIKFAPDIKSFHTSFHKLDCYGYFLNINLRFDHSIYRFTWPLILLRSSEPRGPFRLAHLLTRWT